jgi:uracil-DNA glycosylase
MNEARKTLLLAEMGVTRYQLKKLESSDTLERTISVAEVIHGDIDDTSMSKKKIEVAAAPETQAMQSRREHIMQSSWGQLKAQVSECRACPLCESRKQTVFGIGDEKPDWVIIGEAPGANEDEQGEPFVGQSGKLLDNMLASIGLSRGAGAVGGKGVFILNTLKCRPPENRNPEPAEMAQCEPFLKRQLELLQPKIILCVGRFAITSLLNTKEAVGSLRGRVHHYAGIPTIVTYHPAYLLRNLADKAKAWEDLCFAREVAARHVQVSV